MIFREPLFLLLFLLLPLLVWLLFFRKRRHHPALVYSDAGRIAPNLIRRARRMLMLTRAPAVASWIFLVIAFAGPQREHSFERRFSEGVDIIIALDVSGSMRSVDDRNALAYSMQHGHYYDLDNTLVNRLQHAKSLTGEFVHKRADDRLGLVIFAGYAVMKCPLTFDHEMLGNIIREVDFSDIEQQSTAIGMAIASALQGLAASKSKSRILILITDGVNNAGTIGPETASEMARALGVRIYTVGIGSDAPLLPARRPGYYVPSQTDIDQEALQEIARKTGGEYFYASDSRELAGIYERIDSLEKSMIERRVFIEREERYQGFLWLALASIILSLLLRHLVFRIMPVEAL
ncbi:MAG: VWA domain-containing protein [Spirochaetota bacterium]|jgi:Ca-activated chloride channel family protein|nr:VWA domain-containing protein [Spirochaetota bacterium]